MRGRALYRTPPVSLVKKDRDNERGRASLSEEGCLAADEKPPSPTFSFLLFQPLFLSLRSPGHSFRNSLPPPQTTPLSLSLATPSYASLSRGSGGFGIRQSLGVRSPTSSGECVADMNEWKARHAKRVATLQLWFPRAVSRGLKGEDAAQVGRLRMGRLEAIRAGPRMKK